MARVPNYDMETSPSFTAAQTADNWIDGTAAGSATNDAYGWWVSPRATAIAVKFDTAEFHSGTQSLKVSTTNTTGRARVFNCKAGSGNVTASSANAPYLIPAKPSTSYTLVAWCKTSNVASSGAFVELVELNSSFSVGTSTASSALTGTNAWTKLTVTITTASTCAWLAIDLQNAVAGNVSDAWFDDIELFGPRGEFFQLMRKVVA